MKILKRRRKERKTDYGKRIKLLKSEKPRIIFRKSNRYIVAQYILSEEAKDKIRLGIISKDLLNYGWPKKFSGSLKSLPASYLTGFLIGKKIKKENLESPIIDIGMNRNLHHTKVYAFLKGLIDSGLEMKHKDKTFPEEDRIKGKNLKNKINFDEIKSKINEEK
jgi:large subunit ribosomal protein L18